MKRGHNSSSQGFVEVPLEARFWAKVDKLGPDECWPWQGFKYGLGYGRISTPDGTRTTQRVAWTLANDQPWPEGMLGLHHCDNPPCCNPAHIYPGTPADNMRDKVARGRGRNGARPRTHCRNGHAYTPENTKLVANGYQECIICRRAVQERYNAKRAA